MTEAGRPSPDPLRLSVPKAFVALAPGSSPSAALAREIFAFCRDKLAPYQRVRRIEFSDLPKTISGKIRRVELRGRERDRAARGERGEHDYRVEDFEDAFVRYLPQNPSRSRYRATSPVAVGELAISEPLPAPQGSGNENGDLSYSRSASSGVAAPKPRWANPDNFGTPAAPSGGRVEVAL